MPESGTKPMIKYKNTVPGVFVRRVNRFVAEVLIDGKTERVHVKNTGRLRELLMPEARITLEKASDPKRKTAYDLISVYKTGLGWVNIDSLAPNELNDDTQPAFGEALVRAAKAGVRVASYGCRVEADSIRITDVTQEDIICSR